MRKLTDIERQVLGMIHAAGGSYIPDSGIDPQRYAIIKDLVKKRRLIWEETDAGPKFMLAQGWSV